MLEDRGGDGIAEASAAPDAPDGPAAADAANLSGRRP
jgi:hypothetical protein